MQDAGTDGSADPGDRRAKSGNFLTSCVIQSILATLALQSPGGTTVSSLLGAIPFVRSVGHLFEAHVSPPSSPWLGLGSTLVPYTLFHESDACT